MSAEHQEIRRQAESDVDPRIDLAVERTVLALERTQLGWIRTALGLLAASVAMDKGLEALHQARVVAGHALVHHAHVASLVLIAVTLVLFAGATVGYHRRGNRLAELARKPSMEVPWILWQSLFLLVLGTFMFALLLFNQPLFPPA